MMNLKLLFFSRKFLELYVSQKRLAPCCERSNHFIEDLNFKHEHNQMPSKLFLYTSDIFSWPFWADVTNGEVLVFIAIFVQVYQR